jgi:DNA-directed RNA polymerase subunit RPC12/RpoP
LQIVGGYVFYPSTGRRQKKRLKGEKDACQGRLAADYDISDFEADANKLEYLCSKCHKEVKTASVGKKSNGKKSKSTKSTRTNTMKGASNSRVGV